MLAGRKTGTAGGGLLNLPCWCWRTHDLVLNTKVRPLALQVGDAAQHLLRSWRRAEEYRCVHRSVYRAVLYISLATIALPF